VVPSPTFYELTHDECVALLARNHIGRIAFSHRDHVDIEPIGYVFSDGWLYGRTSHGTKLRTLAHNRWVAFETDEVRAMFEWRSVVVKGALYILDSDGSQTDLYQKCVDVLRSVTPHVLDASDPTPSRNVIFRIHADQLTGRGASPPA